MENENQTPQQALPQPIAATKWYQHTGFISILVLALLAAAASWIYFFRQPKVGVSPIVINHKPQQTIATSSDISKWKTYNNADDFSFQYPNFWSYHGLPTTAVGFFTKPPDIEVLDINVINSPAALIDIANNTIIQHGCPGDRVMQSANTGVLFVLNCSTTSENYNYIFRSISKKTIELTYHDDFDENMPETNKIATFKDIISTIINSANFGVGSSTQVGIDSSWTTYTDPQFSIQTPGNWTASSTTSSSTTSNSATPDPIQTVEFDLPTNPVYPVLYIYVFPHGFQFGDDVDEPPTFLGTNNVVDFYYQIINGDSNPKLLSPFGLTDDTLHQDLLQAIATFKTSQK